MSPPYSEGSSVQPVHSVLHAVRVLEFFASHPEEHLSLTDVSRGLQMHKTTVYRILRTLQSVGWVEQSQASGKYRLGSGAMVLAAAAARRHSQRDLIAEEMARLAEAFHELVVLATVQNGSGQCVDLVRSKHSLSVAAAVGYSVPLQAGATGKALLSAQPDAFVEEFLKGLPAAQARALGRQVEEIRRQGFCWSESEVDQGVTAVAVPLTLRGGTYAMSISGPTDRLRAIGTDTLRQALSDAVRKLRQKDAALPAPY